MEFIDAYNLLDLNLRFLSIEKILLNSISNQFEEYFDSVKWPESDQIIIETENNLVSIFPVLEEGLLLLSEISILYKENCESSAAIFTLLPLQNEIFRAIGLIFITSKVVQKQFLLKQKQTNPKISNFFEQAASSLSSKLNSLETFSTFLISLRSDPQIQSKCTKNSFLFLIEFYLDSANLKKVYGTVLRIFSRFNKEKTTATTPAPTKTTTTTTPTTTTTFERLQTTTQTTATIPKNEFFDSIKCLNLPINQNSTILICRKCHRTSSSSINAKTFKSRRELIFTSNWQQSLWKSRCQCGSIRRIINMQYE